MSRLLLTASLWVAACGPSFSKTPSFAQKAGGGPGDTEEVVCADENTSPRGTTNPVCRPRSQIENEKRFAKDVNLDSHPRPTYN